MTLLLHDLYPGTGAQYVGGLEPDLLGEAMVWRVLSKEEAGAGPYLDRVFERAESRAVRTGFEVLGRLSEDHKEAEGWIERVLGNDVAGRAMEAFEAARSVGERTAHAGLGRVLATALEREGTIEIAKQLQPALPRADQTVSLREVGRWVLETRLKHLSEGSDEERARLLGHLNMWQSALGPLEAALASAQEVMTVFRRLAEARPDAFLPDLATCLYNLSLRQSTLAQPESALASAREAVEAHWPFFLAHPDAFARNTALLLDNILRLLESLGLPAPPELLERRAAVAGHLGR